MSDVLLVGEANPYGGDPRYALWPEPRGAAGDRLCRKVMGLEARDYLRRFDRANLCPVRWSAPLAVERAAEFLLGPHATYVLLGRKVREAFFAARGIADESLGPFASLWVKDRDGDGPEVRQKRLVLLPHPSGRCRDWNLPNAYFKARVALHGLLP